jgi:hypothetical protein
MHGGNWGAGAAAGWLFAHESGHALFGLFDQYQPPPAGDATPRYCGHTTMANNSKATAFCTIAHCRDGQVFNTAACDPNGNSDWKIIDNNAFWTAAYPGPRFGSGTVTAYPTPFWNNPNLQNLVTFTGF